ncbi:MAG: UDP-N-acetylmuramoyl-L-alanine--D-glutamate ligase [Clostridia bacterium]|nr:UDP-N-acetylmuramoyl-L-alanine--D-glutamate ligase [Clostridia bacterium]MBQ9773199.1 UDP-N-acetylmuramoyl-L-alanine--D-glutamate ligase [Clostridia bacterium]
MKTNGLLDRIQGASVGVIGLGVSNLPLIDFLLSNGANVTARDQKTRAELGETAECLAARGVHLILGAEYLRELNESLIFRSPGLRPDHPALLTAQERGAILTSEMELFLSLTPATVIGITGSDGKTTTTTLTGLMLSEQCRKSGHGKVFVGGNIGTPLLPRLFEMSAEDYAVVELSSFQLQTARRSADIAAITNLSPNHLNWHTDMEEYIEAKTNIYRHAPNRRLVTNAENAITARLARDTERPKTYFSSVKTAADAFSLRPCDRAIYVKGGVVTLFDGDSEHPMLRVEDIRLPGRHNLENYMTAIALTDGLVEPEIITRIAREFAGVAHRLERVRTVAGVTYYNSSIDSSPSRTVAALSALRERPIVICGGKDKNTPFEPLAQALCERAKAVILTGEAASKIRAALADCERVQNGALPVLDEPNFEDAVRRARDLARAGDTVLLSPACTSFDAFKNFEERGECFRRIVCSFEETEPKKGTLL